MVSRPVSLIARALSVAALLTVATSATAATEINQQVLQGVGVFNRNVTLDMKFDTPSNGRPPDFAVEISGFANLGSCQRNGTRGIFCIDGKDIRRWARPEDGGLGEVVFSCTDVLLGLDKKRADPCTALAVAQTGTMWIAGRRNSASVLIRVYEKNALGKCELVTASPERRDPALNATYCFKEYPKLRPVLSKLVVVEGEEAGGFDPGTGVPAVGQRGGILGLDIRDAVTYSRLDPAAEPVDLITKSSWALAPKEILQDLTLLQTASGDELDPIDNFVLVTTSTGRVLARQTDAGSAIVRNPVFNLVTDRTPTDGQCPPLPASAETRYGIAASNKTGRVYATDRAFCRVLALEPIDSNGTAADGIQFDGLDNVKDGDPSSPSTPDLTLSTVQSPPQSGFYAPDGVTVAPGTAVDLATDECQSDFISETAGGCPIVSVVENDGSTTTQRPVLRFAGVDLNDLGLSDPPSRVVVFKIENIPDCRYRLFENPADQICAPYAKAVVTPAGKPALPGEQYLDLEEMLPQEIRDQFTGKRALPTELLISPQYRGRGDRDYLFGAVFFVPEPDVVFKDTFEIELDVAALVGVPDDPSRCSLGQLSNPGLADLVRFDVVTRVSEKYRAPGAPGDTLGYVDTIINSGCGTIKGKGTATSAFSYGLEPAYNPGIGGNDDDDVYARLVAKLFEDLDALQTKIACVGDFDVPGSLPLNDCSGLNTSLRVTRDKFNKCLEAAVTPQTSLLDRACNAFEVQLMTYQSEVDALPANTRALDPANRIGELKARLATIWLLYDERFLPSVPPDGYTPLPTP